MRLRAALEGSSVGALSLYLYRQLRDTLNNRLARPRWTPHGFALGGCAAMQAESFEPDLVECMRGLIAGADVLVDVGANVGFYACLARSLGRRVVAIEPHPTNVRMLLQNLRSNSWEDVEVFPVGLGASAGMTTIFGGGTGASLRQGWDGLSPRFDRQLIPLSTLDTITGDRFPGQRLLIKIDVEGWEHDVLAGAARTLALQPAPRWIVEICLDEHFSEGINPSFRRVFDVFWNAGYEARTADPTGRRVTEGDVERWVANGRRDFGSPNYLFTRQ